MVRFTAPSGPRRAFPGPDYRALAESAVQLVPASAFHLHAAAAGAVSAGVALAPEGAVHGHFAGAGAVGMAFALAGAGAVHAHAAGEGAVSVAGGSSLPVDATALTNATATWWGSISEFFDDGGAGVFQFGYSKSDGRFGAVELNATTGAVIDAREVLNEPTRYLRVNNHFMTGLHRIRNGAHAGKLVAVTIPHDVGVANGGAQRFYCRYSPTGRTAGLMPVTGDFVDTGENVNLGMFVERASDGQLFMATLNDSDQTAHLLRIADPTVLPVFCRPFLSMLPYSGGTAQLYVRAVPGLAPNTMRCVAAIHPSVEDAPFKAFMLNLATGEVIFGAGADDIGGTAQGSGTAFDTSGAAMTTFGDAPTIYAPTGATSTRLHDLCKYGSYRGGRAVAITYGPDAGTVNNQSHALLWCAPASDPEVLANWTLTNIGATLRAQTWDTAGGRRYNNDIIFLPPRGSETIRVALVARNPGVEQHRIEIWASDTTPAAMTLRDNTEWEAVPPRPMKLVECPSSTSPICAVLLSHNGTYNNYDDFVPAPIRLLNFTPRVPVEVTAPVLSGTPTVNAPFGAASGATFTAYPLPITVAFQWWRADTAGGGGAAAISGATGATYTPVLADEGKFLQRRDIPTNSAGTGAASLSNWSAAVGPAVAVQWSDFGDFALFDPATGITLDTAPDPDRVTSWNSNTAGGGAALNFANATASQQPNFVPGPPARIGNVAGTVRNLAGDAAARAFTDNRSALMLIVRAEADTSNGTTSVRPILFFSTTGGAGSARITIRHGNGGTGNLWASAVRALSSGDTNSIAAGAAAVVPGQKYLLAAVLNMRTAGAGGSTHRLFVDGVSSAAAVAPANGAATEATDSALAALGRGNTLTSATVFDGKYGAAVVLAKNSGNFSDADIASALAKYNADFPAW